MNTISANFELAQGGVTGKDHRPLATGSQDASAYLVGPDHLIALVCDGCGSGPHSEVGAQIGAKIFAQNIKKQLVLLDNSRDDELPSIEMVLRLLNKARDGTLRLMSLLADNMDPSFSRMIDDYFLFTIIGAIVYKGTALFFSLGDGVIIINDDIIQLGPFPGNKPPYLGYHLIKDRLDGVATSDLEFQIHRIMPSNQIKSCLLATDGIRSFMAAAEKPLPGKTELVGPISQFWTEDRFFTNPDMVRRRLFLANREVVTIEQPRHELHRELGHLEDDTTLIVIRRKKSVEEET